MSEELRTECLKFVEILFSEEIQSSLSDIGMLPAKGASGLTINIFSDASWLEDAASAVRSESSEKNPEKFFEFI